MIAPAEPPPPAAPAPAAPAAPAVAARPVGEVQVWLSALGLAIGLIMVAGLLGLVVVEGLRVFWPRPIDRVVIAGTGGAPDTVLFAAVLARSVADAPDGSPIPEVELFTGSREVLGRPFRFVTEAQLRIDAVRPPSAWWFERREFGPALAAPVRLVRADGTAVEASEPGFGDALGEARARADVLRAELRQLEKRTIGALSARLEAIRVRLAAETDAAVRAELEAEAVALSARFGPLAAEARALRERLGQERLRVALADGAERDLSVGDLVRAFPANGLDLRGKAGVFLSRLREFLTSEPREANTEGGIFPAIFGTFVMTVLMSAAVLPFGVIAAIYLREYARQGFLVQAVRIAVNNLAGVPSIVFGVFGLGFFVYGLGGTIDDLFYAGRAGPTFGTGGILWASLTLALMTVPVVIVATEEALSSVPRGMREASLACGASKWQTIQRVLLPASAPGILTGLILAMARGAGEVAPLMLVGVVKLAPSLPIDGAAPFLHLERKFMHLGFHIYDLGFQSPDAEAAKPMVFATTLLLILLVLALNLGAILLRNHLRRRYASSIY